MTTKNKPLMQRQMDALRPPGREHRVFYFPKALKLINGAGTAYESDGVCILCTHRSGPDADILDYTCSRGSDAIGWGGVGKDAQIKAWIKGYVAECYYGEAEFSMEGCPLNLAK